MKGLILAGGAGTRLRPITHTSAKQLVPVANKPILFYGIEHMVAAGITDIGIIVGDTAAEITAAVGDGSRFGAEVTYIRQAEPLGLANCVLVARDFLGESDFVMYLGDNMLEIGLDRFVARFLGGHDSDAPVDRSSARILLCPVSDPRRFGVAEIGPSGEVIALVEKPENPPSDLALVGVYLFTPAIHEAVDSIAPSPRGEYEITDAIQWLIDNGHPVHHDLLEGWWLDTGKKDPLLEANRRVLQQLSRDVRGEVDARSSVDGNVVLGEGSLVENSRISGPVAIAEGVTIINSYVGPSTAIASGCTIKDSELEHSVILEGCRIEGVPRMIDSLIGRETEVKRSGAKPTATRLMVGDHCSVDLG